MKKDARFSFLEFVEMKSPQAWAELQSIDVTHTYPFARSCDDLERGEIAKPTLLPFAHPEVAAAALRKMDLERQVWREICVAVHSGEWECQARHESSLNWRAIPARILSQATPNFAAFELGLLGDCYVDVEFTRILPISADEFALRIIRKFCASHDPAAHRVEDVRNAIATEASLSMSDGRVRKLMRVAGIDERWFARGRRSARRVAGKP